MKVAKSALRKSLAAKIDGLNAEEISRQSENVVQKLISTEEFKGSQRISVYLSIDKEVSTVPILRKIFETNKLCYVPRYDKNVMKMVRLSSMQDYDQLPLTKWNIKQPSLADIREDALETGGLDLIICPGVAFTKSGHRLGHGKGYYDSFLRSCKEKYPRKSFKTIALAFKEQILDEIPTEQHDFLLDMVLCSD